MLKIGHMIALPQSVGSISVLYVVLNRLVRPDVVYGEPNFRSSSLMRSQPVALPFLNFFTVTSTSMSVI